jgi:F-type H+-transporting ATPase subunit gamma
VTRRRDIDRRLKGLGEIREILGAMRNLALLESRKLARAAMDQERVVATIRAAIGEVLPAVAVLKDQPDEADEVLIVVGSERGFCGDFNGAVLNRLAKEVQRAPQPVIVVGQRLAARLPASISPVATLAGATTTEEVGDVLVRLMRALGESHAELPGSRRLRPVVLHHCRTHEVARTVLDPLAQADSAPGPERAPPRMYLPPEVLAARLTEHFLYAVLHQTFQGSLVAENEQRMIHMDKALRRIDERVGGLRRRRNEMRQEEITEEIEVIIMSAAAPSD